MTDLLKATPETEIMRRDIYDRPPIFKWADGEYAAPSFTALLRAPLPGRLGLYRAPAKPAAPA